jgi:hypothetical protein
MSAGSSGQRLLSSAYGAAAPSNETAEQPRLSLWVALRALVGCAGRTVVLLWNRRLAQPASNVGRRISFADGTSACVYRETVIDRSDPVAPAVLVVGFRLRRIHRGWAHQLFRWESELNTILFAGFPGLVTKLWLRHDEQGLYRGVYQWDDPELAVAYVRALSWVLALVSEPESIHYAVLPTLYRDDVLDEPSRVDTIDTAPGGWWRPVRSLSNNRDVTADWWKRRADGSARGGSARDG